MRALVLSAIRHFIPEPWNADALRESFYRDRSSSRGNAFTIASSSLFMMPRARHLDQCHIKWRRIVLKELSEPRVIEWARLRKHPSFDHFAECDVYLSQREETARLWLREGNGTIQGTFGRDAVDSNLQSQRTSIQTLFQ